MIRQLVYVSRSNPPHEKMPLDPIYESSRHNNALDGVTGLLFADGYRFCQVLEGSDEAVGATFERICDDPRHRSIDVLRDAIIPAREFGQWSMADRRRGERSDEFDARLNLLLRRASPRTQEVFQGLLTAEV